jgi:hypothetical protein
MYQHSNTVYMFLLTAWYSAVVNTGLGHLAAQPLPGTQSIPGLNGSSGITKPAGHTCVCVCVCAEQCVVEPVRSVCVLAPYEQQK